MIISNPIIVKTDVEYEVKVNGPSIDELLTMFPTLRLRDDKYLYFENEGFSPETAIDYSKFTFKTDRWQISTPIMGMPTYPITKDTIFRMTIIPIHPDCGENYTNTMKGQYSNAAIFDLTYEEASKIYDDPKKFLDEFVTAHPSIFSIWIHEYIKMHVQTKSVPNLGFNNMQQSWINGGGKPNASSFDDLVMKSSSLFNNIFGTQTPNKKTAGRPSKKTTKSGSKHGVLFNSKEDVTSDNPSIDDILADAREPITSEIPVDGVVVDPAE